MARLADRMLEQLGYDGQVDALGVSWGGAAAQQFAYTCRQRCRRLILAATTPGVLMVPGRLSLLRRMLDARRYSDPQYMIRIAPRTVRGALRRETHLIPKIASHLIPKARLHVVDDGHLFLVTSAPQVGPIVREFLSSTAETQ